MNTTNTKKPWLDVNGKLLNDEKLKEICKTWNQNTWDEYLETLDKCQKETFFENAATSEFYTDEDHHQFIANLERKSRPYSRRFILTVLSELPTEQRKLLEKIYFQGLSLSQIAREAGTTKPVVLRARNKAINDLMEKFFAAAFNSNRLNRLWEVMEKTVLDHFPQPQI